MFEDKSLRRVGDPRDGDKQRGFPEGKLWKRPENQGRIPDDISLRLIQPDMMRRIPPRLDIKIQEISKISPTSRRKIAGVMKDTNPENRESFHDEK